MLFRSASSSWIASCALSLVSSLLRRRSRSNEVLEGRIAEAGRRSLLEKIWTEIPSEDELPAEYSGLDPAALAWRRGRSGPELVPDVSLCRSCCQSIGGAAGKWKGSGRIVPVQQSGRNRILKGKISLSLSLYCCRLGTCNDEGEVGAKVKMSDRQPNLAGKLTLG